VLTHEDATDVAKEPYMSMRFRPLQAVEMLGRSKNRDPPCPSDQCVYWWWKDRGDPGEGRQQTKTFGLALPCC